MKQYHTMFLQPSSYTGCVLARTRLWLRSHGALLPRDLDLSWVSMSQPRTVTMETCSFCFAFLSTAAEARVTPRG